MVVADRQDYIDLLKVLEKRMRMWVRVTAAQEAGLVKLVGETFKKGKALDCGLLFEHHIDDYVHFIDPEWQKYCHHSFDPAGSVGPVQKEKPEKADCIVISSTSMKPAAATTRQYTSGKTILSTRLTLCPLVAGPSLGFVVSARNQTDPGNIQAACKTTSWALACPSHKSKGTN